MSRTKKDRLFPNGKPPLTEARFARMIATALHRDYGALPSPVKQIGLLTGANLRSIKNWLQGRHAPSSLHLLTLARISPSILEIVRERIGDVANNVPLNVPIITPFSNLNARQIWFLKCLQKGQKPTARSLQLHAGVTLKTARRDIAQLKEQGLVRYTGARKKGHYTLT